MEKIEAKKCRTQLKLNKEIKLKCPPERKSRAGLITNVELKLNARPPSLQEGERG
jgi:hypothetical protein